MDVAFLTAGGTHNLAEYDQRASGHSQIICLGPDAVAIAEYSEKKQPMGEGLHAVNAGGIAVTQITSRQLALNPSSIFTACLVRRLGADQRETDHVQWSEIVLLEPNKVRLLIIEPHTVVRVRNVGPKDAPIQSTLGLVPILACPVGLPNAQEVPVGCEIKIDLTSRNILSLRTPTNGHAFVIVDTPK